MLQKFRSNQKGFTLIELMIVIAIIGILAAIAVPQFMAYRMRGYHSMAAADCRNFVAGEASMFEDGATYGIVDYSVNMNNAIGSGLALVPPANAAAQIAAGGRSTEEGRTATDVQAGIMLTGSRQTTDGAGGWNTLIFAFPLGVGDGVEVTAGVSVSLFGNPLNQDSYIIMSEHQRGIRAFAADSDVSTGIFFAENEAWDQFGLGTISAVPPAVTVNVDNLTAVAAGGRATSPNWAQMK